MDASYPSAGSRLAWQVKDRVLSVLLFAHLGAVFGSDHGLFGA